MLSGDGQRRVLHLGALRIGARQAGCGFAFGAVLAFCLVVGFQVYRTNSLFEGLNPAVFLGGLAAFAAVWALAGCAFAVLFAVAPLLAGKGKSCAGTHAGLVFALAWAALFASFALCLHAYWPGLLNYDIPTQTNYVFSGHWKSHHPPLHTLIWALFLRTEGFAGLHAISYYALFQSACLAAALAWLLRFLYVHRVKRWMLVLAAAFLVVNPPLAIFAITPTKDILFGACLLMFCLKTVELVADPDAFFARTGQLAVLAFWLAACCLLRSNSALAALVFVLAACGTFRTYAKRLAAVFGTVLVCLLLLSSVGYRAMGIAPGGSAFASVPFQQIAHVLVFHEGELDAGELAVVEAVMSVEEAKESYNPRFADKVVRLFKGRDVGVAAMKDQIVDIAFLWLSWGLRYPADYLDAFICINVPYWYPFAETPDPYSQRDYIETWRWKEADYYTRDVELPDPDAFLYAQYEAAADYSAFAHTPAHFLYSPAMPFFYLLLCLCALLSGKWRRAALVLAVPGLYWLSFMIGPVSNMRYMLPLLSLYPLLWALVFQPRQLLGGAGAHDCGILDDAQTA